MPDINDILDDELNDNKYEDDNRTLDEIINDARKGYNRLLVPNAFSFSNAMYRGLDFEKKCGDTPNVVAATTGGDFYERTSHCFFPTEKGQNFYHTVFNLEEYRDMRIRPIPFSEHPRPDFERPIWRHIGMSFSEVKDSILPIFDKDGKVTEEFKSFHPDVVKQLRDIVEKEHREVRFEDLFKVAHPYCDMDMEECRFLLVTGNGAYIDMLSKEGSSVLCVPCEFELELEKERELEYQKPQSYIDCLQVLFERELEDERMKNNDWDNGYNSEPEYGELEF